MSMPIGFPGLRRRPVMTGPPRLAPLGEPSEDRAALHAAITTGARASEVSLVPLTSAEGSLLGPFAIMLLTPKIGLALEQVGAALRFEPNLPARLREMIVLAVAAHTGCQFEWAAHERAAIVSGLDVTQLQSILDAQIPERLDTQENCAIRIATRLLNYTEIGDDLYAEAIESLGLEMLATIVWLVGYYSMIAQALATFRLSLNDVS